MLIVASFCRAGLLLFIWRDFSWSLKIKSACYCCKEPARTRCPHPHQLLCRSNPLGSRKRCDAVISPSELNWASLATNSRMRSYSYNLFMEDVTQADATQHTHTRSGWKEASRRVCGVVLPTRRRHLPAGSRLAAWWRRWDKEPSRWGVCVIDCSSLTVFGKTPHACMLLSDSRPPLSAVYFSAVTNMKPPARCTCTSS